METLDSKPSETATDDAGPRRPSRRSMLGNVAMGAFLATAAGAAPLAARASSVPHTASDFDILNFALNLEYLEAEFYNFSVYGKTIAQMGIPITGRGERGLTTGGVQTKFNNRITYGVAEELATDERDHVLFLRSVLASDSVAKPAINLAALGMTEEMSKFLVLARAFEDTGVSAYGGAAPLIDSKDVLGYAARILATEAYHAGNIRLMIAQFGLPTTRTDGQDVLPPPSGRQYFTTVGQALAVVRTPAEVLAIVRPFFPHGLNGAIK
ncbi:MAG: ferritin-like domain-containing protein [Candidatus Eremiobacteraeota bacterium]|nr:ferritin-like domain-containing protein [Candidatus Eremiobacteraeota bacterium]